MKEMRLDFDDKSTGADELPPWEMTLEGASSDAPSSLSHEINVPSDLDGPEPNKDLEIYRKAEHFKRLHLLSGNGMSDAELSQFVESHYGVEGLRRLKLAKFVLTNLGYKPSPDTLLMLSCTKKARVVIATAGAGKTTSLQFDLVISKMLDGLRSERTLEPKAIEGTDVKLPRILYLNYNKHNVRPIEEKHISVCSAVNKLLRDEDAIDNSIESSTVHAFCHKWLKAFSTSVELPELNIIREDEKTKLWDAVAIPRWKKFYGDDECLVSYDTLDELYNYKTESMLEWDEFFQTAKFVDSDLKPEFVKSVITKYDALKLQLKLMDFTDYLLLMIKTLKEHPELRERLLDRYKIIIADENQDFTRLMNELLIQLYDPKCNQLIAVGDPDQTIYAFKGVSPDNVVGLVEALSDVELLGLDTNYRCPDVIVDAAKSILDLNSLRFVKPINTVRTGGKIVTHSISQQENQEAAVLRLLNNIGKTNLRSTVITYRNNISGLAIAEELYYAGIPFTILDDRRPFSNPVFVHIRQALKALKVKDDFELNKLLYRFLPLSKEAWFNILEENRQQRRYHFHDLQVHNAGLPQGAMDALRILIQISQLIDVRPVCDFIAPLLKLYRTYYFDFVTRQSRGIITEIDSYPLYYERMEKFFNRPYSYDYMMQELAERNVDNPAGVTLSTFHGLKGLEFDYVIAIDFKESVFPNYFSIEQKYSENTALEEKESENRLCYVLVTRAIKELHLFFPLADPSIYVGILTKLIKTETGDGSSDDGIAMGSVVGSTGFSAQQNFLNRLIGGRG